jgi:outer membrane biosynthesis protein TonB
LVWSIACGNWCSAQRPSATPIDPFRRHLYDQIGSAWYRDTRANLKKLALGKVRIAVTILSDGKIAKLRVVSNTSNELLANISLRAIREAKIPPVPPELLTDGKLEDELVFDIYH